MPSHSVRPLHLSSVLLPESCLPQIQKLEADIRDALLVIEGQEVTIYESMLAQNSLKEALNAAALEASEVHQQSTNSLMHSQSTVSRLEHSNTMLRRKVCYITLKAPMLGPLLQSQTRLDS